MHNLVKVAGNGLRLCEGGEIEVQMFKFAQMPNRIPNVQFSTSAPLLQNLCYLKCYFFSVFN